MFPYFTSQSVGDAHIKVAVVEMSYPFVERSVQAVTSAQFKD